MKKQSKILVITLVLAVLCTVLAFVISAETEVPYTGTVAEATEKLNAAKAETDVERKFGAIKEVENYLSAKPVDPKSDGYDGFVAALRDECYACATGTVLKYDSALGTSKNQVYLNRISYLIKFGDLEKHADFATLKTDYEDKLAKQEEAKAKLRAELENKNSLEEYDLADEYIADYDNNKSIMGIGNISGFTEKGSSMKNFADIEHEANGNGYFTVKYLNLVNSKGGPLHTYMAWVLKDSSKGVVFDWDFATFGDLPKEGIHFEAGEDALDGSGRTFPKFYYISNDGSFYSKNNELILSNAVVKGEWLHITTIFHPGVYKIDFYCEYEYIGTYDCSTGKDYKLTSPRFGKPNLTGEYSIDNVEIYQGSNIRQRDKFDKMTDEERFIYYGNYLMDETKSIATRGLAYKNAANLLPLYYNVETKEYLTDSPEVRTAVDNYNSFDYDKLLAELQKENLGKLEKMVNDLVAVKRAPDSGSLRQMKLEEINAFIKANGDLILKNDTFNELTAKIGTVTTQLENEEKIRVFNTAMYRFDFATSIVSLQKHYNTAKALLEEGLEVSLLENPEFKEFKDSYDKFTVAGEKVEAAVKEDNSRKVVACVDFIKEYDTEEEWIANHDFVEKYVIIVRNILRENYYNAEYEGLDAAIAVYTPINDYFYNELQQKHITEIDTQLKRFASTESYIEKVGICAYIKRYLAENDIDNSNLEIQKLLKTYEVYVSEVELQEEDYGKYLDQNTTYFINLVAKLKTCLTYKDMKPVYDEASVYYYAMNVGTPEAKAAIAVFDDYTKKIETIEKASEKFIESVAMLDTVTTKDGLFSALVTCCVLGEDVDLSYEGTDAAMKAYEKAYNDYMTGVNTANEEVKVTGQLVCAVRANCGVSPVIATVIKIIFKK